MRRVVKPWYVWRPWQLARRVRAGWTAPRGGYRTLPIAWGVTLIADPQTTVGWSLQTTGVHDLAVSEVLARLVQPGDTVVDAGAHIGYMTTLAALAAGPDGHVVAWEPHPDLFAVLERNVAGVAAHRRLAKIALRNAALGGGAGSARLVLPDPASFDDATSYLARTGSPPSRSIHVKVETIDEVLESTEVALMKLDVERAELEVLAGATEALQSRRIRHIVFENHEGPASDVVGLLKSMGYEIFAIGWSIRGLRLGPGDAGTLANAYEAPSYVATLAPEVVTRRCASAGWKTLSARFASEAGIRATSR